MIIFCMSDHSCNALIATCIDFRFQKYISDWISQNFEPRSFDRVAIAGGVFDSEYLTKQVAISHRLHHIHKVILINHEDCGAYGESGTGDKHAEDLKNAAEKIKVEFPEIEVKPYYLHFNGAFEEIS